MPENIRFCGLVVELHMHTNVYAVYARGCSLSNMSSGYGYYDLRASSDYISSGNSLNAVNPMEEI